MISACRMAGLMGSTFLMVSVPGAASGQPHGNTGFSQPGEMLPPDFRGQITYQGQYRADLYYRVPASAGRIAAMRNGPRQLDGAVTIQVTYDGSNVTGRITGTGQMQPNSFQGTRNGGSCAITDQYGVRSTFRCDRSSWMGESQVAPGQRVTGTTHFEANATQVVDLAEQARQQAARAAQPAQTAARPDPRAQTSGSAADLPRNASGTLVLTTAALGISLDELLNRIVIMDSRTWNHNRYEPGSMRNARYEQTNRNSTTYVATGRYNFRQGFTGAMTEGWTRIWVRDGEFACIQFHDDPRCRPLDAGLSQRFFTMAIGAMMNANMRESGLSGICADVALRDGIPVMTPRPC